VFRSTLLCYSALHSVTASEPAGCKMCRKTYPIFEKVSPYTFKDTLFIGLFIYLCISLREIFKYVSVYKRSHAGEHMIEVFTLLTGLSYGNYFS
jgi:hypothetical protein